MFFVRRHLLFLLLCLNLALSLEAATWSTSYAKSLKKAKDEGKPILANFTGSDWCGWCIKLESEVFSKKEFNTWAKDQVVLLKLDFPRQKKISSTLRKQNSGLAKKFGVRGYPSILFIDPNTEESIGKSGYQKGGPKAWVTNAQRIVDTMPAPPSLDSAPNLSEALNLAKDRQVLALFSSARDKTTSKLDKLTQDSAMIDTLQSRVVVLPVLQSEGIDEKLLQTIGGDASYFKYGGYAIIDKEGAMLSKGRLSTTGRSMASKVEKALPELKYEGGWIDSHEQAMAFAAKLKRPVLMNFTGSDWCGWCIRLHDEVFKRQEFQSYAKDNLVLLTLDFPKAMKMPGPQAKVNKEMARKYKIKGYPTLVLVDAKGREKGRLGYVKGGPKAFLKELKKRI